MIFSFRMVVMIKKRVRNHVNPLNFTDRLTKHALNVQLDKFSMIDLEIGFGRGKFISQYAKNYPDRFIVGVEVRRSMVDNFNERYQLSNLLAVWGTAQICLEDMIPNGSLTRVFIFHPDPWFKKRHYKRRVINHELLSILQTKLNNNGRVYISTDVSDLYDNICEVCDDHDYIETVENDDFWATDYNTHWSMFSTEDQRNQYFLTLKFKEMSHAN